jgi:hypothetical protein
MNKKIVWILLPLIAVVVGSACTPFQRRMVVDAAQATCVLIRTNTDDQMVKEVCATAEELAPYVKQILSSRALAASASASASSSN